MVAKRGAFLVPLPFRSQRGTSSNRANKRLPGGTPAAEEATGTAPPLLPPLSPLSPPSSLPA
jgi:hypothetical protein